MLKQIYKTNFRPENKIVTKMFVLLLSLCSLLATSNCIILDCEYSITSNWNLQNIYTCTARVVLVAPSEEVTDVTTNHLENRTNSDVEGIIFNSPNLGFTPRNIDSFFPNLASFDLRFGNVSSLQRVHLTGFNKLKELRFDDNNLRVLESDLFIENPLLEWISLDRNPIWHVGHYAFDQLHQLHSLSISQGSQACINRTVFDNRNEIENFLFQLIVYCPATFEMIESKIVNGIALKSQIYRQISDMIDPITKILLKIEENQQNLTQRIAILEDLQLTTLPPEETTVQQTTVQQTTAQETTVQQTTAQETTVQQTTVGQTTVGQTTVEP